MIDLKKELNDKQYEAAVSIDGPQLIIAGAGSGKTRMITFKTAFMIENAGIAPEHILALTFTNKAAAEMKERIQTLIGERAKKLTVSTFHSFGLSLIRRYGTELGYSGRFSVYDADDAQSAAKEAAVELKIPLESVNLTETAALFSAVKTGRTPLPAAYKEWYEFYNRRLKAFNAVDFDDLLALPLKLLSPKSTETSRLSATTISRFIRGEALISATSSALSEIFPNGAKSNWNRTTVQPKTFWKPPTGSFPAISIEKQKTSGREENPAGTSNFSLRRTKKLKPPSSRQPSVPFALTTNSNTTTSPCWSEPIRSALRSKQNC